MSMSKLPCYGSIVRWELIVAGSALARSLPRLVYQPAQHLAGQRPEMVAVDHPVGPDDNRRGIGVGNSERGLDRPDPWPIGVGVPSDRVGETALTDESTRFGIGIGAHTHADDRRLFAGLPRLVP